MDEKLLESLGLSSQEIRLYKMVFEKREISPSELAKTTGIKRTTAYSMARGLVEKGLLIEDGTKRPRVFLPTQLHDIERVIENEKKKVLEKEKLLLRLAQEVKNKEVSNTYPVPKIRFVEEEKIDSFLHQRSKEWISNMSEVNKVFWGFQDPTLLEYFVKWIDWFWEHAPKDYEVKLLTNLTETEKNIAGKYERRQTKFWGEATDFKSTTWILGDYVIILNTRQKPFYLIEIHDKLMAHDQREVFRNLWEMI
jgi:sugar-specific transcriptional regulator TrmB